MRVLIDATQAGNRSGTGRYTTELIKALLRLNLALDLVVLWADIPLNPPSKGDLAEDVARGARLVTVPGDWFRRTLLSRRYLQAAQRRLDCDVVHGPSNFTSPCPGASVVLTIHDLSFLRHPEWFRLSRAHYYRWAIRRSARRAKHVIADSHATARDLQILLGVPEDRISVVPLGVGKCFAPADTTAQQRVRRAYALPESFFLFVGTIEPRKNLPRLIEAWSRIAGAAPQDLVIAGRHGWKTAAVEQAARQSAFCSRIHFPGFIAQEDLPALLSAADAFVWPSLFEGFGLPPLEAMACGTPVLTSNNSSLPEVVGDAALTIDPTDSSAISEGLLRLAREAALCDALREKGRARAGGFTWERTARLTYSVYQAMME